MSKLKLHACPDIKVYPKISFCQAKPGQDYVRALGAVAEQRNPGVQVFSYLKVTIKVDKMMAAAFDMPSFIGQSFEHRSWDVML